MVISHWLKAKHIIKSPKRQTEQLMQVTLLAFPLIAMAPVNSGRHHPYATI